MQEFHKKYVTFFIYKNILLYTFECVPSYLNYLKKQQIATIERPVV